MGQSPRTRILRALIFAVAPALIIVFPGSKASADDYIWGGGSGLWRDGTKWLPIDSVPTVGDGATIGGGQVLLDNSSQGAGTVDHLTLSGILNTQGNPYGGGVEFHAVNNIDILAGGSILLDSYDPTPNPYNSAVRAANINNHGSIIADPGTGGAREIQGYTEIQNFAGGQITAYTDLSVFGNITNAGAINVKAGTTHVFDGGFINANGGGITIASGAYMLLGNATFYFLGGTVGGEVELQNDTTLFASTADGLGAKFAFTRAGGQLISNLPVNTSVRVIGNAVAGGVTLTVPGSIINYGNITLETDDGPFTSGVNVAAGTLTNNGFIFLSNARAGGPREMTGTFINNLGIYDGTTSASNGSTTLIGDFTNNNLYERLPGGTTTLAPNNTGGSVFRQKNGQLLIDAGSSFTVLGSTFAFSGGSINGGTVSMISSSHLQTTTADGHGAIFTFGGNGFIDTDLSAGVHVNLTGVNSTVVVNDGATNNGYISLYTQGGAYQTGLAVFKSATSDFTGTYTNHGYILSTDPNNLPAPRVITGNVMNYGSLYVGHSLDIFGTVTNKLGGSIDVQSGQLLSLHGSGNKLIQDGGLIHLAKTASLLFSEANYQYLSGSLTIESTFSGPGGTTIGLGDVITAAGTGATYTIDLGGITVNAGELIGNDGGTVVSQGGGNIVAQGGGNIVAQGGGNIVSQGGGNVVSQGGGNVIAQGGGNVVSQGGGNVVSQGGGNVIAQGGGNVVSQGGGNVVSQGGGNVVAQGGGNLTATFGPSGTPAIPAAPLGAPATGANIIADGGIIKLDAGSATADGSGIIHNGGTLTGNGTFTASAFDVDATSTVAAAGGTLHLVGTINQFASGELAAGHWQVQSNSTLHTPNIGAIAVNNASVMLNGTGSVWTNINSLTSNKGTFTISGGRIFTTATALINSGILAVAGPGSSINVSGPLTGGGTVNVSAGAQVQANYLRQNAMTLDGQFSQRTQATGGDTSILKSLTLTTISRFDLADNALIVDYATGSPIDSVRAMLLAGYANGTWAGNGLNSTLAAANASTRSIGYAEASNLLGPAGGTFGGQPADGTAVLIRYTLKGDANLDGAVGFADLVAVAQHYGASTGGTWFGGDLNYDGVVGFADLVAVAQQYGAILPAAVPGASASFEVDMATAFASVPEPATLGIVGAGALLLYRRKCRIGR